MALPVLTTPTYELEVPSTGEKLKYRPFLVKEEKILLMALESADNAEIIQAIKTIVSECTFNKLGLGDMPIFDVEYIFLQIRSKSVGEVSNLRLLCEDDGKTYADIEINLSEIAVEVVENHTNKIELTDEMGIIMTYPTIDSYVNTGISTINTGNMLDVISSCILQIYDKKGEEVFEAKDQSKKELTDFIEQLNTQQFKDLQKFFDTMPKLTHTLIVENPKTKVKNKVILSGLSDFFA
tara:strand:+ start:732 stop:1445 length:714 start_codon:yes stop_codon:yes gene_type:complete